jgi:hypothetical protein
MAAACLVCGTKFSWMSRLSGKAVCDLCQRAASQHYRNLLAALVEHRAKPDLAASRLKKLAADAGFDGQEQLRLKGAALKELMSSTLARGDRLSEDDEAEIAAASEALALPDEALANTEIIPRDLISRLGVARANADRLETILDPKIMLKKGEIAHLELAAQLLKEVRHTIRQYSGFSFRIVKGVYYHVGQSHPLSSTNIEVADFGTLTVTSQRVVYTGDRQSLEVVYAKLLAVKTFSDGIEFNLSNRKNAPLFRLAEGLAHVVAATINAAIQRQAH